MYFLYLFSKITKYIALISLGISYFSDLLIFKWLCWLIFIDLSINFSEYKCSILQIEGMISAKLKFRDNRPSVANYKNEVNYSLPFNGEWVVVNGCFSKEYSHSWGIPSQRYAYDFSMLDEKGKSYKGEFSKYNNYYCYEQDILSPAEGTVIEVFNDANDSLIFSKGRFFSRAKHIAGNYIVIQHSSKEYSLLAHLKRDSIAVSVGENVLRGQCIAKCGNTGNSTEPHLHFQVQGGRNFYKSIGLPIRFNDIQISESQNYKIYDSRPHMALNYILEGYITRGFSVKNK